MKRSKIYFNLVFIAVLIICTATVAKAQLYAPADRQATTETRELFYSMQRLVGAGVIFGHHDDTAYGVGWRLDVGRSDVKSTAGSYPAMYGWDLAKIEHDSTKDINNITFKRQKELVKEAYQRGGINTFCWHMDNPVNGRSAWDTTQRTVKDILPGGVAHNQYKKYLDKAAAYLGSMKGSEGEPIPILFRPFHELTGNWFWWCANTCTPDEFKSLWQFTIGYIRNNKKLHNLLVVYSVADFDTEADFMTRYPGNDYVDFVGFDNYCVKSVDRYQQNLDKRLALLDIIAAKNHKVACLPETGYERVPQADWWTNVLLKTLSKYKTSYVMAWRNDNPGHFYAPYPGQVSEADFKEFASKTLFQKNVTPLALYGKYMPVQ
ncbi:MULTISPECIES: glycosyl hydrolase [unclassified Mucilaginibacter]|uniref:glycoside hydrolase family 26 protein n=1 Tax=unclassified Mucilaginibacter TaxID=2617802 RepID=UPI002AC9EF83|nr:MULTISPECIES: glycosyl hydrolase [unclassified Mucilaginibacter]MEB0263206.1 glycosyl hydrolase [Mucilaginibacter sp. 10I4]MEB0278676.1 glycosyl hydrolase [Mucilaginibacter sp. 10B2]MEB0299386.1 glycosyl hydrolase [Mucilaginibacter sp. 5C4]WPX23372.1 glycosyl hydrolase [Mucilaginibacter sp. 5C4]